MDYIIIKINEVVLNDFVNLFSGFLICLGVIIFIKLAIQVISDINKRDKKIKFDKIAKPYRIEYKKLLDKENYKKVLNYREKYGKYLEDTYY